MGDGTNFVIDVDVEAGSAEPAAAKLARLSDRLIAAGAASTQAAAAVAAGEVSYKNMESTAEKAAKAVEKIGLAVAAQEAKLKTTLASGDERGFWKAAQALDNLKARQSEAVTQAKSASDAVTKEAAALDGLKTAADKASKVLKETKAAAEAAAKADAEARGSRKVNEIAEGFGKLGGPLGRAGQQAFSAAEGFKKLGSSLGTAGPYAAVAIAIVAITTAAVTATVAIAAWAISLSDTARTSSLLSAGIAGTVEGGKELDATISKLGSVVPQTREELLAMAGDLAKTGLKGAALSDALEESAVKAAKLKWGPDFAKQMTALSVQSVRLQKNIASVFNGLNLDKLLDGLSKIVALFDAESASGKAVKVVFESLFQPLIDGMADAIPKVIGAILQLEIWFLKAAIFVKPFTQVILYVAEIVGGILVAALGLLAIAVVGAWIPFAIAVATTVAVVAALIWLAQTIATVSQAIYVGVGQAFDWLISKVDAVISYLKSLSLSDIGAALIAGFVIGITGGGDAVFASLTGIVKNAITGVKGLLGIHSPSTVFAAIGMNTAAGMSEGVDDHAGKVQGSLESMVASPSEPKASSASAPASPAAKGVGNYAGATFNFFGVEGAQDAEDRFLRLLEGDMTQAGRAVPA